MIKLLQGKGLQENHVAECFQKHKSPKESITYFFKLYWEPCQAEPRAFKSFYTLLSLLDSFHSVFLRALLCFARLNLTLL